MCGGSGSRLWRIFCEAAAGGRSDAILEVIDPGFSFVSPTVAVGPDEFLSFATWQSVAGNTLDARTCSRATSGTSETSQRRDATEASVATFVCEYDYQTYLTSAVDAPPVAATDAISVTSEGRALSLHRSLNVAALGTVNARFETWVAIAHPGTCSEQHVVVDRACPGPGKVARRKLQQTQRRTSTTRMMGLPIWKQMVGSGGKC